MKPWMAATITIAMTALLLAGAWVVFSVGTSATEIAIQGKEAMAKTNAMLQEAQRVVRESIASQRSAMDALRNLCDASAGAVSKLAIDNGKALERISIAVDRAAATLESKGVAALDEVIATIRSTREELVPRAGAVLDEIRGAAAGVQPVLSEAQGTLAATTAGLQGISGEVQATVAEVRPAIQATTFLIQQGGEIAQSGAAVAKHYEKMILHPSLSQRAKGWFQLVLSGFTLWGNAKVIF